MGVLDSFRLDGKVVVVTGASSGLGVSFAEGFAKAGADVVLGARRVDRMAESAALVEATGRTACRWPPISACPSNARRWSTPRCRPSVGSAS